MKTLATAALVSLVLAGCATTGNNVHPDLDVRTRVMSPDGSAFVECPGPDGCPDELMQLMADYKPPTEEESRKFREEWIYKLEHPRALDATCDQYPTVPWESWEIVDGGPSANLPGYSFYMDGPSEWTKAEKARRPQVQETDKPIGKVQQGDSVWLIYRVQETNELVSCGFWSGRDIPEGTCDLKHREPLSYCSYSQKIVKGH